MKEVEIRAYRQDLRTILSKDDGGQRHQELTQLARAVGAGYVHSKTAATWQTRDDKGTETIIRSDHISEAELVLNINDALQTETTINALTMANRSWIVAVLAALISLGSIVVDVRKAPATLQDKTPAIVLPTSTANTGSSAGAMGSTETTPEEQPEEKANNANPESDLCLDKGKLYSH